MPPRRIMSPTSRMCAASLAKLTSRRVVCGSNNASCCFFYTTTRIKRARKKAIAKGPDDALQDLPTDSAPDDNKDFTEAELKDLRTAFCLLDRDRDGRVNASELQFMLRNMGIHVRDELLQELLSEASHSGNGLVDEAEFLQWVARIQALTQDPGAAAADSSEDIAKDLVAAFRVFDRDCNGYITKDELKTAMDMIGEPVTEVQLNEMLAIADIDKDGRINYEEFARLLS